MVLKNSGYNQSLSQNRIALPPSTVSESKLEEGTAREFCDGLRLVREFKEKKF